jgi:hypothetical protein
VRTVITVLGRVAKSIKYLMSSTHEVLSDLVALCFLKMVDTIALIITNRVLFLLPFCRSYSISFSIAYPGVEEGSGEFGRRERYPDHKFTFMALIVARIDTVCHLYRTMF